MWRVPHHVRVPIFLEFSCPCLCIIGSNLGKIKHILQPKDPYLRLSKQYAWKWKKTHPSMCAANLTEMQFFGKSCLPNFYRALSYEKFRREVKVD